MSSMEVDAEVPAAALELAEPPEETAAQRRERRKKTRWGEETEAGKKVLEQPDAVPELPGGAAGQADREGSAGPPSGEPAPKKRRSRWEPAEDAGKVSVPVPGLGTAITLPPSLAGLVDLNPETRGLQNELNQVRRRSGFLGIAVPPCRASTSVCAAAAGCMLHVHEGRSAVHAIRAVATWISPDLLLHWTAVTADRHCLDFATPTIRVSCLATRTQIVAVLLRASATCHLA